MDGDAPVNVDGLMEVIGWQTQPGYAVHLLNYNGPNAFRGHTRKFIPLRPQVVRVTLPNATPIRAVRLLRAGGTATFKQRDRTIEVSVPTVDLDDVVTLEVYGFDPAPSDQA